MVPPTWLQGLLLLCQCVWPGYSAYHSVIETSYPVNTTFSSGGALAFIMSIHPRISCTSEKHELRKFRVSQCPWRESIHWVKRCRGEASCPLLSQVRWESMHLLEALLFWHLPDLHSYSVSTGLRANQNIRLSSEHLKNNGVMFDFSVFIFQVKVFLSCEPTAQSSQWVARIRCHSSSPGGCHLARRMWRVIY